MQSHLLQALNGKLLGLSKNLLRTLRLKKLSVLKVWGALQRGPTLNASFISHKTLPCRKDYRSLDCSLCAKASSWVFLAHYYLLIKIRLSAACSLRPILTYLTARQLRG